MQRVQHHHEIFSGAWEKSAAVDSAEPTSKEILLRPRQLFVAPAFYRCQDFVDARILSMPVFCRHQYFVNANNFVYANIFYFV
jgi:hypothetical protein